MSPAATTVAVANLALLAIELLRAYERTRARLDALAAGEPADVSDLLDMEAETRARLDALRKKLTADA